MTAQDEIIARVIEREGGVAQVPGESFVTRYGQTPGWLEQFGLPVPATAADASRNYAAWLSKTGLDTLIGVVPDDLADIVIDFAVHAGHLPAIRLLQAAVGVKVDGILGPKTVIALSQMDRDRVARKVLAGRLEQVGGLLTDNPAKFSRYARGWLRRIGEQVRQLA